MPERTAGYFANSYFQPPTPLNGPSGPFTGLSGFTFSAWVKLDPAYSAPYYGVIDQGYCINRLLLTPSGVLIDAYGHSNAFGHMDSWVPVAIPSDTWFNIVLAVKPVGSFSTADVFINGSNVGEVTGFLPPWDESGQYTLIGDGESFGTWPMYGSMYDVRIYEGDAAIPEPSTLVIWSLLGSVGVAVGWWRRRRTA